MGGENDKNKEGQDPKNPASILSWLPGIAGDIAKIAASPERKTLKKMQSGQGAGTAALRGLASRMAREQYASQAQGHGATRGLGIVGASERANDAIASVAPGMGVTAAREQAMATQALRQNRAAQIASAADLGWKLTGGIGGAIANMLAARDQGPQDGEEQGGELLGKPDQDRVTGLTPGAGAPTGPVTETFGVPEPMSEAALTELAQSGEVLPGAGVSLAPYSEGNTYESSPTREMSTLGASEAEALMREQAGLGSPAKSPEQEAIDRERGAEARRKANAAQLEADKEVYKATSRASEPYPDAPLGTAVLTGDPQGTGPMNDDGLLEWIWGRYRDGESELTEVHDFLRMHKLPLDPPEWLFGPQSAGR